MTLWGHGNERWGEHTIGFDCVSFVPNPIKSVELWIRHYTGYCCEAFHDKIGSGWAKINLVLVWIRRVAEIKVNCKPLQMHARTMLTIVIIWNVSFIELICLFVCLHTSSTSIIYKKYGGEAFYWSSIDSFNNIFLFLTVAHENWSNRNSTYYAYFRIEIHSELHCIQTSPLTCRSLFRFTVETIL